MKSVSLTDARQAAAASLTFKGITNGEVICLIHALGKHASPVAHKILEAMYKDQNILDIATQLECYYMDSIDYENEK